MNDNFRIQVDIAGKRYKVRCERSDELLYRKAANRLKEKLFQYQAAFPDAHLEQEDLLSMVAFHFSLGDVMKETREDISPVFEKLEELNADLEKLIKSNS